ncbi:hypothetical heme protein [Candidatus Brocadia sinica JPN1]|uniref:Hypothetical heme protein n=2 Tax=Candidatus Brocadiaceae TaxID=1127830 RepID=A0ABQ0JSL3_9BACT|nr:hypothetical heme protein [Candidatus Brocadia sinica JPN1]GIK12537.1 MAG: hypothetical protein BroJett002_12440 [Candidatus Brocadia sinica]GJQ17511.1 MAG: hypothetical protein HBSIN01_14700 [Candidatus Brocadia sinica]
MWLCCFMKYGITMHLGYFFFISFILTQQLAWGNGDNVIPQHETSLLPSTASPVLQEGDEGKIRKPTKKASLLLVNGIQQPHTQYPTGSCIDRCHVNYATYQTMYDAEFFRHRVHSPKQGMECNLCHENYIADMKPHGNLIIQDKDCVTCHHKAVRNAECLKCHAGIKDYMEGCIQDMLTNVPDWMSKDVSCSDCHKLELDGSTFKPVRESCIECHSTGYGALCDLWKEILDGEIKQYCENERNILNAVGHNQTQSSGAIILAEQINTVAKYLFSDSFVSPLSPEEEGERRNKSQKKRVLPLDISNRHNLLQFIRSYGIHNILLSQILLKSMENEQCH